MTDRLGLKWWNKWRSAPFIPPKPYPNNCHSDEVKRRGISLKKILNLLIDNLLEIHKSLERLTIRN